MKGAGEHVARASFLLAGKEVMKIYFFKGGLFWRFRELVSGVINRRRKYIFKNLWDEAFSLSVIGEGQMSNEGDRKIYFPNAFQFSDSRTAHR